MEKLALVLMLALLITTPIAADEQKESKRENNKENLPVLREEITVTATTAPKPLKNCTSSISVIGKDEIRKISATNALNLLASLPGVFIQRTGDFGRADVDIRGLGQNGQQIMVMTDGRPEKMGLFGCVVTQTFPLDNVSRIDVIRGPASVIYGSDALGGVVNIITSRPQAGFETDLFAGGGSYHTQQYTLRHGGSFPRWHYYLTANKQSSDGHIANSGYNGFQFTGKASWQMTDAWQVAFQGKYYGGKKYEPTQMVSGVPDTWNDYRRGGLDLTISRQCARGDLLLRLYHDFGRHQFSDGWNSRDATSGGLLRYFSRPFKGNELVAGFDFRYLNGSSYAFPRGSWSRSEQALFVHDDQLLLDRLTLSGGFRLHRDSQNGWEGVPEAGIIFQFSQKFAIRGRIAKGFRTPQLSELYMFPVSNPDLQPERVWNHEIGIVYSPYSWLSLNTAFFYMWGSNMIETVPVASSPGRFRYENTGAIDFSGVELGAKVTMESLISASVSCSIFDPRERTKGRPKFKLDSSVGFSGRKIQGFLALQHVSGYYAANDNEKPLPSYFILNSRLSFTLGRWVDLWIDLNNIFDSQYSIFVNLPGASAGAYPMPGRNIQFGLHIKT